MARCSFEEAEVNLYSDYFEEFKANEKDELTTYINTKINLLEDKYYSFVLIKYKDTIIKNVFYYLESDQNLVDLKKSIQTNLKTINKTKLDEIKVKIFIVGAQKKNIVKKFKKEFCNLQIILEDEEEKESFSYYLYENKKNIVSVGIAILMIFYINKLSDIGILINFLSIDTLTIITYTTMLYITLIFLLTLLFSFVIAGFLTFSWDHFFNKQNCNLIRLKSKKMIQNMIVASLGVFIILLISDICFTIFNNRKASFSSLVIQYYITQTREPTIREVYINNNWKTILLMGKDSSFIYYLYPKDIKTNKPIIEKQINDICSNKNINASYIHSLIELLYVQDENTSTNFIANKRYRISRIRDIKFSDKTPKFNEIFCNKTEE